MNTTKYGRVIVTRGRRRVYRAFDHKADTERFFELAQERFGKRHVYMACYTPTPRPRTLNWRTFWCPYCAEVRQFRVDARGGVKRCVVCGITENDFEVQKANYYPLNIVVVTSKRIKRTKKIEKTDTKKTKEDTGNKGGLNDEERRKLAKRDRARARREARRL